MKFAALISSGLTSPPHSYHVSLVWVSIYLFCEVYNDGTLRQCGRGNAVGDTVRKSEQRWDSARTQQTFFNSKSLLLT